MTVCSEDNVDVHDIELLQYINVDCAKLKRLLKGKCRCISETKHCRWKASVLNVQVFCTNCVELEHQSGFDTAHILVKWTIMLNGSKIFEPLKTKMRILILGNGKFCSTIIFALTKRA